MSIAIVPRVRGLPEPLPADELLLWQGAPHWPTLARDAYHVNKIALYFGVLIAWRASTVLADGGNLTQAVAAASWLLPLALLAIAALLLLAWLTSRATVYTLTSKRLVMRIGIVLTITLNIPYRVVEAAAFKARTGDTGDIKLSLAAENRIAFLHLWPHARPFRVSRPEPMLRAVSDGARVAKILSCALARSAGVAARLPASEAVAAPRPAPVRHWREADA